MSDFIEVTSEGRPRWWRVLSISGKDIGLGFECPRCHLGYAHDAPKKIKHCGEVESAPLLTALLPTRQLGGGPAFPRNIILSGW